MQLLLKFRIVLVFSLFASAASAFAVRVQPFTSWAELINKSPDIVIARCVSYPEQQIYVGIIKSSINVISVVKGDTQLGPAELASLRACSFDTPVLIFSEFKQAEGKPGYIAIETYRLMPLAPDFDFSQLPNNNPDQRLSLILQHRLSSDTDPMPEPK